MRGVRHKLYKLRPHNLCDLCLTPARLARAADGLFVSPSLAVSPAPRRVGRILAIGGGKGGVGKSLVSTNLAVALAATGARVVVLDADLGAPNLHSMFGIARPQRTVEDFLAGRTTSLDEIALPTAIPNLRVICGAEGALGSASPNFEAKQGLLSELARLPVDCLLIDVGAGVDLDTIDFFNAADTRLVVMVPEVTSLQNGYSFLKIALFRRLQRAVAGLRIAERIAAALGTEAFELGSTMDRVSTFFSLLEDHEPEAVVQLQRLLGEFNAYLVGNMLHRPTDANALYAMQRLIRERLGLEVEVAATLRHNALVRASVNTGRPFTASAPASDRDLFEFTTLATRLVRQDLAPIRKLRDDFLRALGRREPDPDLDARFAFGLEGIPTSRRVPSEPRPAASPAARDFTSEYRHLQRASERLRVYLPVELDVDGRWYMGQLVEVNEGGGKVTGIRAPASWANARGVVRLAGEDTAPGIAVAVHSIDAGAGSIIVRFEDAAAGARLVASLRTRPAPAASGPRAAVLR